MTKMQKEKSDQPQILYPAKLPLKNKNKEILKHKKL